MFAGLLVLAGPAVAQAAPTLGLIPWPAQVETHTGSFTVRDGTAILVPRGDAKAAQAAAYFADLLRRTRGLTLPVKIGSSGPGICITTTPSGAAESYRLDSGSNGVQVSAASSAGLLYGTVTLWQLLTEDGGNGPATLPAVAIADAPRFGWRGLMLDSTRHFQSPQFVEQMIDWMALHKLNVLHWHLVDDQGWRLEIKRYPRLTSVGAWRVEAGAAAAKHIDPATGRPRLYGGFYSQAEVRRIVAFAKARNVTIIPEIEMPGHASAAIAAYPELGSIDAPPTTPSHDWGVHANLLNTNDRTFAFLQNVLRETMALFPSGYIHIGGDEAVKDQWNASPAEQARMKALGITDPDALQSWYLHRIETFLNAHGRRLIGWDEILKGGLAPNATVMSWHGVAGAVQAAKLGHDAVVTPSRPLYFNYRQSDSPDEPPGRAPLNTLADVYAFEPAPAELTPDQRRHVLGVQANLWTEYVRTDARIEHMLFPRLSALAEIAWSPQAARDWPGFEARMVPQLARYRSLGIDAAASAFAVRIVAARPDGAPGAAPLVRLSSQAGFGAIHYTLDGTAPSVASPVYARPITVTLPQIVKATPFLGDRAIVPATVAALDEDSLLRRRSAELRLCKDAGAIAMEDDSPLAGHRAVFVVNYIDRCWIYDKAQLDGVAGVAIDVGSIPFNLQLRDGGTAGLRRAADGKDALEIRRDGCKGPALVRLPLDAVRAQDGVTTLTAPLPAATGVHDLCFQFVQAGSDPIWTIDSVRLTRAAVVRVP